jgi:hypothetical protein
MRVLLLALGVVFGLSPHPHADLQPRSLIGTWRFVSYQRVVDNGKPVNGLGEHPKGYIILTAEGRMMLLTTSEGRKAGGSDADRAELGKSMVAYAGKYRLEGDDLITTVDVSWNEEWNGTEQKRHIAVEGDRLILTTYPAPSPIYPGKSYYAKAVFEREK